MKTPYSLIALAARSLAAGGAHAQVQTLTGAPAQPVLQSRLSDAAKLNGAVSSRFQEAGALKGVGMARTSFDGSLNRSGASGAFGFLCGRPDSLDDRAAASPLGSDPHGRFLGARLSLSFR